jgi:hypothetical protein
VTCGKKLRSYRLNRLRRYDYGETPLCGRRVNHPGNCMSEEALERERRRLREKRLTARKSAAKLSDDGSDENQLSL